MSSTRLRSTVSGRLRSFGPLPLLVTVAGAVLFSVAIVRFVLTVRADEPALEILFDLLLISVPGIALLYVGTWMPRSEIEPAYYPRLLAWVLGGVATMFGFIVLRDLHPGVTAEWSLGTQAIALTIGSIGGLLIGIKETRAAMHKARLEERTIELSRRERELERQNERLEQFASVISHDLRNPLNVARGRVELAGQECDSEHLDHAVDAHDRMETMITNLLELARQGEGIGETESVRLSDAVEECWRTVETGESTLSIEVDRVVRADPSRLRQLLENLIRNAIDHNDGPVRVTVGDLDDGFYVADDGDGIAGDDRDRVFETAYTTASDGTGFGLAIVAEIATAHGWTVGVTESRGGGARFDITDVEFDDR